MRDFNQKDLQVKLFKKNNSKIRSINDFVVFARREMKMSSSSKPVTMTVDLQENPLEIAQMLAG